MNRINITVLNRSHLNWYRVIVFYLLILGCDHQVPIDTNKDTYYDDIADITCLNGSFFTSNYDLSGNAGSQIDLLKFEMVNGRASVSDSYDLDMNGQGYLAICNDGVDLYLQSRSTELIVKCSAIGEKAFLRYDAIASYWQPSGIAFDSITDSLVLLYRNTQALDQYRLRILDRSMIGAASRDLIFDFPFISRDSYGIYAMEAHDTSFYFLGVDTSQVDVLVITNRDLTSFQRQSIPDSTVVGLAFQGDDLHLSYRDRRIEFWAGF